MFREEKKKKSVANLRRRYLSRRRDPTHSGDTLLDAVSLSKLCQPDTHTGPSGLTHRGRDRQTNTDSTHTCMVEEMLERDRPSRSPSRLGERTDILGRVTGVGVTTGQREGPGTSLKSNVCTFIYIYIYTLEIL